MTQGNSSAEFHQEGYVIDAENVAEMARLLDQDKIMTTAMGGLFPERDNADLDAIVDVLDIACGPGGWAHDVAHSYPHMHVTGIDVSKRMIDYAQAHAKARGLSNARFQVMDATHGLAFQDNSFDLVNARTIIGFMATEKWPLLLSECKRILRPGGTIRLTEGESGFTNSAAFETLLSYMHKFIRARGNSFSPTGLSLGITFMLPYLLRQAGFTGIQVQSHVVDSSYGRPGYGASFDDMKQMFQLLRAPIMAILSIGEKDYDRLYEEMLFDMQKESFCAIAYTLTAWGEKESVE